MIAGAIILVLYVLLIGLLAFPPSPWKRDPNNPFRRTCKKCGQVQELYQHALGGIEWCDMGTDHEERHREARHARG